MLAPIFVPSVSEGPLIQPPEIRSVDGVLAAEVKIIRAGVPGSGAPVLAGGMPIFSNPTPPSNPSPSPQPNENFAAGFQITAADGRVLPPQFPAPTLHLEPGDTLDLTTFNALGNNPPDPPPPPVAYVTNLHTHGFLVNPLGNGDNVYREMTPEGTFRTRIEIPRTQQSGVDWYHTHQHGSTADQVYAGLAGLIRIGDVLDPWPEFLGKYDERLMGLTLGNVDVDPATGDRYPADVNYTQNGGPPYPTSWEKRINGQLNPTLTLRPGETEIWTFGSIGRTGFYNLAITDANGENPWTGTVLSHDGNADHLRPQALSLAPPVPQVIEGPTYVAPGERTSIAVTAPTTPGTYYLVDNLAPNIKPLAQFFALATITVEGEPVAEPPPVFPPVGTIPEVYTLEPDRRREFTFSINGQRFEINGAVFPEGTIVPIQAGQIEEWHLINASGVEHPFHIHQTDFAVISINGQPISTDGAGARPYVSLHDTVTIPAQGEVVIRWRVTPYIGKYVFHCHILNHEDAGMMMAVLAGPNQSQRRIALGAGPGGGGGVLVQDGDGAAIGRVRAMPRNWRGGIATAVGDFNRDLVEDIVAAPAANGSPGVVSIFDGADLRLLHRFRPFPELRRAGVSLATGDVDRDGRPEIIAGYVGPGRSRVRIFRPDGTLIRELVGTIPGRLPHGVTVASTDYNGDNYDDVGIGGGLGAKPLVVALDGYSLGDPMHEKPEPLFSFEAGGGARAGVQVAGGYYDPTTSPGLYSNLMTTPLAGARAGAVTVWNVAPAFAGSSHMSDDHSMSQAEPLDGQPMAMATFRPFGQRRVRQLRLQVSRLGQQGLGALAAWTNPRHPRYTHINEAGQVVRLNPQVD